MKAIKRKAVTGRGYRSFIYVIPKDKKESAYFARRFQGEEVGNGVDILAGVRSVGPGVGSGVVVVGPFDNPYLIGGGDGVEGGLYTIRIGKCIDGPHRIRRHRLHNPEDILGVQVRGHVEHIEDC